MSAEATPLVIRRAVLADAAGIARVHVAGWRETYTRLLPEGALDGLDVEAGARRWAATITEASVSLVVAERDGSVVGFSAAATARSQERPRDRQLEAIYVLPSEYGRGTGQALLDAVLGDEPAFLWSALDNPRAQAFYRRNGFVDDGERSEYPLAGHPVAVARFVR